MHLAAALPSLALLVLVLILAAIPSKLSGTRMAGLTLLRLLARDSNYLQLS